LGRLNRLLPFAVSFTVTSLFFINVCAWLFQCGCHSLWAGADLTCNVHLASGRHCPICSRGTAGYAGVFVLVCTPQLLAAAWSTWRTAARTALCLALFPVAMLVVGLVLGWYDGYWL
jgi:hypothetical protein